MRKKLAAAAVVFGGLVVHASADELGVDNPVKDCQPCRFAPGPGQPEFALRFVFGTSGGERAIVGIEMAPAAGGAGQSFTLKDPVLAGDFPEGFVIQADDLDFDGFKDLGLFTLRAGSGNVVVAYWLYRPGSRDFAPLARTGDNGAEDFLEPQAERRELYAIHKASAADYDEYWYRVGGGKAGALRHRFQYEKDERLYRELEDVTATPPRRLARWTGFLDKGAALSAFRKEVDQAAQRAAAAYRAGDKRGALETMRRLLGDKILESLDWEGNDRKLAAQFNDYGFYLEEAGEHEAAIEPLRLALERDLKRTVAYLNLADAEYALGRMAQAKENYAEYLKQMTAAGKADKVPARVTERAR